MGTRTAAVTNFRVRDALSVVSELIGWADDDADHARRSDAPNVALDDDNLAAHLRKAYSLILGTIRSES